MTKQSFYKRTGSQSQMKYWLSGLLLSAVLSPPAVAHLMVAQHGTLNIVGDSVFMVLSLPISAFTGVDDDGDGKLSTVEFTQHRLAIVAAVNKQVQLLDKEDARPLEDMLLSPVASHDDAQAPTDQLVVMGRFALAKPDSELSFHVGLFGKKVEEQSFTVNYHRPPSLQKQQIVLTLEQPEGRLLPNKADNVD